MDTYVQRNYARHEEQIVGAILEDRLRRVEHEPETLARRYRISVATAIVYDVEAFVRAVRENDLGQKPHRMRLVEERA